MQKWYQSDQNTATLLAALRYWKENVPVEQRRFASPYHFYDQVPLDDAEIDELCEDINTASSIPLLTVEEEAHILCAIHRLEEQLSPEERVEAEPVFYKDGTRVLTDEESEALREKINYYVIPLK